MKYVLVTGACGGMGKSAVKALLAKGYTVFALDRKAEAEQERVIPIQADVTDAESMKCALEKVRSVTEKLYAIVHFAGVYMLDSLVEMDEVSFERIFKVNLFGAFLVNKTFMPLLTRGSRILITTSELAPLDPLPFTGVYAVSKSALDKYAYSLRMELQLLGIHVSVLRVGAVDTDMIGASTSALDRFCKGTRLYSCNAERFKRIVDGVEARRISTERLAGKAVGILEANTPKFAYSINRNPLLLMLGILPKRAQFFAIKQILK